MTDEITDQDAIELKIMVERMTLPQIAETLEELAKREKSLLSSDSISKDEELKEVTLWNIAALCAASGKFYEIIQAHIKKQESETSEDQSEEPHVQEEESPPSDSQS